MIRIGNPGMTPLPPMERVVDYPFTAHRSDWMDVFLVAACRFFIGTASGMFIAATHFGTPVVLTNQMPLSQRPFSPKDLFIPKIFVRAATGERLTGSQSMLPPVRDTKPGKDLEAAGIGLLDNRPEEIRDVVVEMMDRLDGNWTGSDGDEERNRAFDRLTAHDWGFPVPRIGARFLRDNPDLLI